MNLKNQFKNKDFQLTPYMIMGYSQKAKKKSTETTRNREKNERNFCS